MTYRFDKSGKRILENESKDKVIKSNTNGDTQQALRTTGTSHLVQTKKSAIANQNFNKASLSNQKIGRKAPDADLRKPLRHIGTAMAVVVALVVVMSLTNMASQMLKSTSVRKAQVTQISHEVRKYAPWTKAEVEKNLLATAQRAEIAYNYPAQEEILKSLCLSYPAETKAALTKAASANPKNLKAEFEVALAFYYCGNFDLAKASNDKILLQLRGEHKPSIIAARAHALAGKLMLRNGQSEEAAKTLTMAISQFEKASITDAGFVETLRQLAWLELSLGKRTVAAALFERVIAASPEGGSKAEKYMLEQIN